MLWPSLWWRGVQGCVCDLTIALDALLKPLGHAMARCARGGHPYLPAPPFSMPATDLTLYAQWTAGAAGVEW